MIGSKDSSPLVRILIVDDFAPWRAQVREILAVHQEWRVVYETSTGQEAVRRATELQPEVVIMDCALPDLNGIEAAKMILQKSPRSRIVFLTLNGDNEVVDAALAVGRARFVLKVNAATELCQAIEESLVDN
jgi:DNA-binding NarL/FixJ family response regulator